MVLHSKALFQSVNNHVQIAIIPSGWQNTLLYIQKTLCEHVCVCFVVKVIEEIEEMMQESPDPEDDESPSQSDLSMLSQDLHALKRSGSNTSYEDREYTAVVVGVCLQDDGE